MNLKPCKHCSRNVATSAKACPHCGRKLQAGGCAKLFLFGAGCLLVLITVGTCMGNDPAYKNRPDPQAGWVVKNNSWDASVSQVESYLKRTLKNPSSYKGVEWSPVQKTDDGYMVRHRYQAENSYGGTVTEQRIFYLDHDGNVTHTLP